MNRDFFIRDQADNLAYILCKYSLPEPHRKALSFLHLKFWIEANLGKKQKNTKQELQQQLAAVTYVQSHFAMPVYHENPLQTLKAEISKEINSEKKA